MGEGKRVGTLCHARCRVRSGGVSRSLQTSYASRVLLSMRRESVGLDLSPEASPCQWRNGDWYAIQITHNVQPIASTGPCETKAEAVEAALLLVGPSLAARLCLRSCRHNGGPVGTATQTIPKNATERIVLHAIELHSRCDRVRRNSFQFVPGHRLPGSRVSSQPFGQGGHNP